MSTSYRIAILSENASPLCTAGSSNCGGQSAYVANLAQQMAQMGHTVDVFTAQKSSHFPQIHEWLPQIRVIQIPVETMIDENQLHLHEISQWMKNFIHAHGFHYDLMHANYWTSGMIAQELKDSLQIPFAMTFHSLGKIRRFYENSSSALLEFRILSEELLVKEADALIAECPQIFEDLRSHYQAPVEKMSILPYGFNSVEIHPVEKDKAREILKLDLNEKILLQVGRITPRKGLDIALKGLARLKQKHKIAAKLVIVGGETEGSVSSADTEIFKLQKLAKELQIENSVQFVGRCKREDLKLYYSAADVFVMTPSCESFGLTALEAMACGTPVIGSNIGGLKFTVVHEQTGYLVPTEHPDALAQRLNQILTTPGLLKEMSILAQRRAHQHFTWTKVARQMNSLFEKMVQKSVLQKKEKRTSAQTNLDRTTSEKNRSHASV